MGVKRPPLAAEWKAWAGDQGAVQVGVDGGRTTEMAMEVREAYRFYVCF